MTRREKHSQHLRLFFYMAGLGAAVISVAGYIAAALYVGLPLASLDKAKGAVIAISAGVLFYQFHQLLSTRTVSYMIGRAALQWVRVVMIALLAYVLLPESNRDTARIVMQFWAIGTLPVLLGALILMRWSAAHIYAGGTRGRPAIFIWPGQQSHLLALRLHRSAAIGINVRGYFGDENLADETAMKRLGGLEDVEPYLRNENIQVVFVGTGLITTTAQSQSLLDLLSDLTASIYFVPESSQENPFQISGADIAGIPLLALHETEILGMARIAKRAMDVAITSLMLVIFAIPMIIIAIGIKRASPGPVLFRQIRYGQDGTPISIYKFRSMHVHTPKTATIEQAKYNDPRITKLGRFLRRTSLDELPQIFNVLEGTMSLVGPRPHAAEHNEFYRQQIRGYMLRHTVKPGITGWAQVNGLRGETDTLDKMMRRVEHDRYYIKNWSLWMDIKIIARTALLVIRDKQAY